MAPTNQRFHTNDATVGKIDLRLIKHLELVAVEGVPQLHLKLAALAAVAASALSGALPAAAQDAENPYGLIDPTMIQVGTIRLGAGSRGLEQVTGADISSDGRRAALSTYAQGYELEAPAGGPFDDIWSQPPAPVALGPRLQGEAIAYRLDGRALLTTSEIVPAPIQQVERRGT